MILNNEELKKIVSGCVEVVTTNENRSEFMRCTKKQLDIYGDGRFFDGPRCDAGVCFDFYYDGKYIGFDFNTVYKSSRTYLSIDLYDGDIMVYSHFTYIDGECNSHFEYTFDEAKHRRIRIYLPFSCGIELREFALSDGAHYEPVSEEGRKKILFLGDSITHGYDSRHVSLSYTNTVARYFNAVGLNQAVGGYFFNENMIDTDLDFAPDIITVAYGTNDWGRYGADEEKYRSASKAYIDKLCETYPNAKIFGILPIWRADIYKRPERITFDKVYEILTEYYSNHKNVTIIDGKSVVPNIPAAFSDGLHPNAVGQCIYAQNVIRALVEAGI